jgi:transposase-like protein
MKTSEDATLASHPPACPFCQSGLVTTKSKVVDAATYWRCTACGEIWNPARHQPVRSARRW